jgi:hypothetical protein
MRKTFFIVMTIILISAMIVPVLDIDRGGGGKNDSENSANSASESSLEGYSLPLATIAPENCSLDSSYKEDWDLIVCESFNGSTDLWVGNSGGTTVALEDGEYKIENLDLSGRSDTTGYTVPILVGAASDAMISVTGSMDCIEGECAWGVFMRSKFDEIVYIFMIDDRGIFSLTGLFSEQESQELGNIQTENHEAIHPNEENTITAIAEGTQMMFYINGKLMAIHEASDSANPAFGLIVWGGQNSRAVNHFESVLARGN